jgi:hypothetical protein
MESLNGPRGAHMAPELVLAAPGQGKSAGTVSVIAGVLKDAAVRRSIGTISCETFRRTYRFADTGRGHDWGSKPETYCTADAFQRLCEVSLRAVPRGLCRLPVCTRSCGQSHPLNKLLPGIQFRDVRSAAGYLRINEFFAKQLVCRQAEERIEFSCRES